MLFAAKSAAPFYEGIHTYYGMAFALAVLLIWNKYVWPYFRPRVRAWKNDRLLIRGAPAVDDVRPETLPLARRLRRIERRQDETNAITERLDSGQKVIVETLEAHGNDINEIKIDVKKLLKNGLTSNDTGDMIYRMGEKLGVVLPEGPIPHDRRETDGEATEGH